VVRIVQELLTTVVTDYLFLTTRLNPVNHLHQFVVAVGCVDSSKVPAGIDPTSITDTTNAAYVWFAPEQPTNLPNGVYFIPPKGSKTNINAPVDPDSGARGVITDNRYSQIGPIAIRN
jgi:hypothetical protein